MSDSDWSAAAFASDPMKFWRPRRDAAHVAVNNKYRILGFISSGTYGRVYKAESLDGAGVMCAIKKFKPDKDATDGAYTGISQSAIREIALNRELVHENIVALREVILEDKAIHMVFEYAEHDFLQLIHHYSSSSRGRIPMAVLKSLVFQLLNGVHYLHCQHVLHRDLKPANVLVDNGGNVKIGDLGLARVVRGPLASLYTGDRVVVTIWYRAPELLLGARHYGRPIDVWAVGCVLAELAGLRPLFKGDEAKADPKRGAPFQRDQLAKIANVLGPPDEVSWPGLRDMPDYATFRRMDPPAAGTGSGLAEWCVTRGLRTRDFGPQPAYDILKAMLTYDPAKRVTAETALKHEWFKQEPLPTANAFATLQPKDIPQPRRLTQDEAPSTLPSGIPGLPTAPRAPGPTTSIPSFPAQSYAAQQMYAALGAAHSSNAIYPPAAGSQTRKKARLG